VARRLTTEPDQEADVAPDEDEQVTDQDERDTDQDQDGSAGVDRAQVLTLVGIAGLAVGTVAFGLDRSGRSSPWRLASTVVDVSVVVAAGPLLAWGLPVAPGWL